MAHSNEQTAQITNNIPVETRMLPSPTNGETIPPNRKQTAPRNADAVPEFFRSVSIAMTVVDVKVSPIMKSRTNRRDSYTQKSQPRYKAINSQIESATIPTHPLIVLYSGLRNLTESAAAMPIAIAFTPKQMLNIKGEYP